MPLCSIICLRNLSHILHPSHRQGNAVATSVNLCNLDGDVLMELDYISGIADVFVGQLGDVDKAVLMNSYIHEGTKLCDIGDYAWQYHALREIIYALLPLQAIIDIILNVRC